MTWVKNKTYFTLSLLTIIVSTQIVNGGTITACYDSDGGINPNIAGHGTGPYTGTRENLQNLFIFGEDRNKSGSRQDTSRKESIYYDHCFDAWNSSSLNEAFCQDGKLSAYGFECPYGCYNGVCLNPNDNEDDLLGFGEEEGRIYGGGDYYKNEEFSFEFKLPDQNFKWREFTERNMVFFPGEKPKNRALIDFKKGKTIFTVSMNRSAGFVESQKINEGSIHSHCLDIKYDGYDAGYGIWHVYSVNRESNKFQFHIRLNRDDKETAQEFYKFASSFAFTDLRNLPETVMGQNSQYIKDLGRSPRKNVLIDQLLAKTSKDAFLLGQDDNQEESLRLKPLSTELDQILKRVWEYEIKIRDRVWFKKMFSGPDKNSIKSLEDSIPKILALIENIEDYIPFNSCSFDEENYFRRKLARISSEADRLITLADTASKEKSIFQKIIDKFAR